MRDASVRATWHDVPVIVDCAVYRDGIRENAQQGTEELQSALAGLGDDDFLWIGVNNPTHDEMHRIGGVLGLHPLAIEDALELHQRPKVERYRDHVMVSIRMVSYSDDDIATHEVNLFMGVNYLLTVRHGGPSLVPARRRAERNISSLAQGPIAALYAVVDTIVDHYGEVATELEIDVEEVESSVFSADLTSDSTRIYRLKREALEFRRAVLPLHTPVTRFAESADPVEVRPYFRDIADHLGRAAEAIDTIDHLLDNALTAHLAQLSVRQNEDMRKLTAGATIFAIPTAIAGIYGMNFELTSFQQHAWGFYTTVAASLGICLWVWRRFKKSGWL